MYVVLGWKESILLVPYSTINKYLGVAVAALCGMLARLRLEGLHLTSKLYKPHLQAMTT